MAEFATCSQDGVFFWDYKSFSSKRSARPFGGSGYHIQSACWSSSNSKLMVAPKWGDCVAWCEPASGTSEWNTIWHKDRGHFTCGCLLSNSRYLLSGSSDGLLMLWDLKNKSSTKTFEGHSSPVTAVASGSSDQVVLSGGQDRTLLLHSLSSSHSPQTTVTLSHKDTAEDGAVTRLRFSVMDRAVAASASDSGCVCLWSIESQRMLHRFPSSGPATDLCFAQSNNKLLVSVGQDCRIRFLDIQQRKEVMLVSTPSPLSSVAILRDGFTVTAGGVDGKIYVYELRAMKSPKHVLEAHQGAVTCIAEQNSAKSSRSSSRKGSSKKSARESSSRLSSLTQSESPVTSATPDSSIPALDHPTQQLVPTPTSASSLETAPQQPLPLASHVPLPGRNLPPQTPFPVVPRGAVQWGQFTTPAQTASDKDSTGIFSPVDSTLSTPHPSSGSEGGGSGAKTAPVPQPPSHLPQAGVGGGSRPEARDRYPLASTFVASTPAMQHPPLGMSGVFSPLDAATPASLGVASGGVRGQVEGGQWVGPRLAPSVTPSASTPALSGVGVVQPSPYHVAGQSEGGAPIVTSLSVSSSHALPASTASTSVAPQSSPSSSQLSAGSSASHMVDHDPPPPSTAADSEADGPETLPLVSTVSSPHTLTSARPSDLVQMPAMHEAGSVHLQYLESLIRDSNEELRLAMHRDIRALGLDMFRQFLLLQQQVGTAVSELHEKIDRLSEENKHLREQLHQYAPNY